jgi:hypothetical protein
VDIDILPQDPDNPDEGVITSQRIVPGKGIEKVQDDLLRNPGGASESTMDDSAEDLCG